MSLNTGDRIVFKSSHNCLMNSIASPHASLASFHNSLALFLISSHIGARKSFKPCHAFLQKSIKPISSIAFLILSQLIINKATTATTANITPIIGSNVPVKNAPATAVPPITSARAWKPIISGMTMEVILAITPTNIATTPTTTIIA